MEHVLGIATPEEISQSFMNDAVLFIMGSLMLSVAIIKQGWDKRIALGIITLTGHKIKNIVFGFTAISALLSSFIGEHTVAALMLPIGMTLIRFTSEDKEKVKGLSAVLLFSIAYGALVGSIGTPSGGGRNVIMMSYLQDNGVSISYFGWILRVYPLVFIMIPMVSWILIKSFTPEYVHLDTGVRKLVVQVAKAPKLSGRDTVAVFIFLFVFLGWVFFSETLGLGTIALSGVLLYLIAGFVNWEDISRNTHWGVIILFGATISLGANIQGTGAALWLANQVVNIFESIMESFSFAMDGIIVIMTTVLANVLSSSATVAVLGPITLNMGENTLHLGLVTAIASAFGFFTAVAAPACTIIYSSGLVGAKDFLKAGWKIGILSIILVILYANTFWSIFF